jgi:3-oxoacyl-(acyl-carrier-protein) synthase
MDKLVISAASQVTETDLESAQLRRRFGRMDLACQLALLAVESLGINFDLLPCERVAICLAASAGSLSTDIEYWKGRDAVGGPSPTLFAYTLPSAAIGEIAIRHRLTGPNLCFIGGGDDVLPEAADLIQHGEADSCVCVYCDVISPAAAKMIQALPAASACALFLKRGGDGLRELQEFDRDMKSLCALISQTKSAG